MLNVAFRWAGIAIASLHKVNNILLENSPEATIEIIGNSSTTEPAQELRGTVKDATTNTLLILILFGRLGNKIKHILATNIRHESPISDRKFNLVRIIIQIQIAANVLRNIILGLMRGTTVKPAHCAVWNFFTQFFTRIWSDKIQHSVK